METKQISNYLVKLDGFKSGPGNNQSVIVIKSLLFLFWFPRGHFLLNLLGWHWLIKSYRLQVYNSTTHQLYIILCVHHPKSSLHLSPFIPHLPSKCKFLSKRSVEGVGRFQGPKCEANSGSSLSKRKWEVAGNKSSDLGKGHGYSCGVTHLPQAKHSSEGNSTSRGITVDKTLGWGPGSATFQNRVAMSS